MSYTIGEVIFGWNLVELGFDPGFNREEVLDSSPYGGKAYSANGPTPFWLGMHLKSIDECDNIRVSDVLPSGFGHGSPNFGNMIHKANQMRDEFLKQTEVTPEFAEHVSQPPDYWIIWGSS